MLPLATAHIAHLCAKAYSGGWGFKPSSLLIRRIAYHLKYRLIAQNKQAPSLLSYY